MMKNTALIIFNYILSIVLILSLLGCFKVKPEDQDLISFRVISNSVEGYISRIALADYEHGRFIKYISSAEDEAVKSHFSPDKKKLIIEFKSSSSANQLGIYDIESDSLTKIYQYYPGIEFPLFGKDPVWNSDGDGFYFTISNRNIYYYDIETNDYRTVYSDYGASAYCISLKSEDSLIIFSNKYFHENGDSNCFFIMSPDGEYLSQVINPYLELINIDGINLKAALYPKWNNQTDQFVFCALDSSLDDYRISITDYNGTYRNEYTNSYYDKMPIWGPGNTKIFFHRPNEQYNDENEAYVLDIDNGSIGKLALKVHVSGAILLSDVTY